MLFSEDGEQTKVFFVDNDNASSRIRLEAAGEINEDLAVGAVHRGRAAVELDARGQPGQREYRQRDLRRIAGSRSTSTARRFGQVWLGQGHTASDNTSEVDLSGTGVVGTSDIPDYAGGLKFVDDDDALRRHHRRRLQQLRRPQPRRPDPLRQPDASAASSWRPRRSPTASSTSPASTAGAFGDTKVAAATAFASDAGDFQQVNGSASLLLASGFNVTGAAGWRDFDDGDRDDGEFVYGKLGYLADWFAIGATAFAVDGYYGQDVGADGDEAIVVGAYAVQNLDPVATELYAGYRHSRSVARRCRLRADQRRADRRAGQVLMSAAWRPAIALADPCSRASGSRPAPPSRSTTRRSTRSRPGPGLLSGEDGEFVIYRR